MKNNNVELSILKLFLNREHHAKYAALLESDFLKSNNSLLYRVFLAVGEYFKEFGATSITPDELEVYYLTLYPASSKADCELLQLLVRDLKQLEVKDDLALSLVKTHAERAKASEIAILALDVADGRKEFAQLVDLSKDLGKIDETALTNEFVTDDLNEIFQHTIDQPGIRWRLQTLNGMLGSLRKGNFGFIFKRPETGGTTFLASECTHFAGQSERPVLWINNEQPGDEVKGRIATAYFGIPFKELAKDRDHYAKRWQAEMAGRILVRDDAFCHRRSIERMCQTTNPSLIVIDQIDKVRGFDDDRDDLELKAIYQWARELSKDYGPVIGVCQASVSAEGKQYLTMDDVDRSKTAKQGEADWILGIGKSHQEGLSGVRFFSVCKNKLIGDADTDPTLRHGKAAVRILPDIARYEDIK